MLYGGRCDGDVLDIVGTEQRLHVLSRVVAGPTDPLTVEDPALIDTVYQATGRHRIIDGMDQLEYMLEQPCPYCGKPIDGHTHMLGDLP